MNTHKAYIQGFLCKLAEMGIPGRDSLALLKTAQQQGPRPLPKWVGTLPNGGAPQQQASPAQPSNAARPTAQSTDGDINFDYGDDTQDIVNAAGTPHSPVQRRWSDTWHGIQPELQRGWGHASGAMRQLWNMAGTGQGRRNFARNMWNMSTNQNGQTAQPELQRLGGVDLYGDWFGHGFGRGNLGVNTLAGGFAGSGMDPTMARNLAGQAVAQARLAPYNYYYRNSNGQTAMQRVTPYDSRYRGVDAIGDDSKWIDRQGWGVKYDNKNPDLGRRNLEDKIYNSDARVVGRGPDGNLRVYDRDKTQKSDAVTFQTPGGGTVSMSRKQYEMEQNRNNRERLAAANRRATLPEGSHEEAQARLHALMNPTRVGYNYGGTGRIVHA